MKSIYLIGSLRNPRVPEVGCILRASGWDVFDDWYAAGPEADDKWQEYETLKGHNYQRALGGYAARHVYHYDRHHLNRCGIGVLLMPAGKSGHLELGYLAGQGKPVYIVLEDGAPARWDVMYQFADVCFDLPELLMRLRKHEDLPSEQLAVTGTDAEGKSLPGADGAYHL
jgi:hypothetical protein